MKSSLVIGAIALGFALLALSSAWPALFPATSNWTPEKEMHWQKVKGRIHSLSFVIADPARANARQGTDATTAQDEYDALKKEDEHLRAEFDSIANSPQAASKILRWTGIALAAVGIVGWYSIKNA